MSSIKDKFSLARYAAEHWVDHARFNNVLSYMREKMEAPFDPNRPHFAAWLQVHDIDSERPIESVFFFFAYLTREKSNTTTQK